MTASYSSFLSSSFYSPVFNTALFDGAFRIYFSQNYEALALKIYHYLQTDRKDLWMRFKKWSDQTKEHVFILIYPTADDVRLVFYDYNNKPAVLNWDEGFSIGLHMQNTDEILNQVISVLESLPIDYDVINEAT